MIPAFVFHKIACCVAITSSAERMATRGNNTHYLSHCSLFQQISSA